MVGIVVVSHSDTLAEGVVRLAREMSAPELPLEAAGGIGEPGVLGTSAELIRAAIQRAMSADGVLVVMDLGSALMSAELAVELLEDAAGPVRLSDAPLVEGTVAAAVAASGGAMLDEVAADARSALAMKTGQIGSDTKPAAAAAAMPDTATATAELAGAKTELLVANEVGLHARPAARFVETVRRFDADVLVAKAGVAAAPVSARSLTNLVALGVRRGDRIRVTASGPQAAEALAALEQLAATGFGDGIGPPTPPEHGSVLTGIAVSAGVAVGPARPLGGARSAPATPERTAGSPAEESTLLERALDSTRAEVARDRDQLAARAGAAEAAIFDAHLALLDDPALLDPAHATIAAGVTAEHAIQAAAEQVAEIYRSLDEPLLAERGTDVLDVRDRILEALTGPDRAAVRGAATGIVIADELTPSQSAGLDPEQVLAIATARGSTTAHAAIIARSLGIPAVVGLGAAILAVPEDTTLLLDGAAGSVTVAPVASAISALESRREHERARSAAALAGSKADTTLASGERIEVFANIGGVDEATRAVEFGAEGVGMLRTEFLYLNRPDLPTEDEQYETFRQIARALAGRPLIVRTLDAGADKPLPALPMPPEANPFLGMRGIRVALQHPELLVAQLRAALRVAVAYPVKVMIPMVATLDEVLSTRRLLEQARRDLRIDAPLELGITVEVPSAALTAARLGRELDFLSIGTNDLTQYTMAAERGDARLVSLLAVPQPAVLRMVSLVVEGAATASAATGRACWVGVCGEMAGDPAAAILLTGLGVTELSMSPVLIPELKAALRGLDMGRAREAAAAAVAADSAETARAHALKLL
jgi:phosphocarrier protein FPr